MQWRIRRRLFTMYLMTWLQRRNRLLFRHARWRFAFCVQMLMTTGMCMRAMGFGNMQNNVCDPDFRRSVEANLSPALREIGFSLERSVSDSLWDGYFFSRGKDRICVFYLERDCEFNFMISRSGGEMFENPFLASAEWTYGVPALEAERGKPFTESELAEMGEYLFRGTDQIVKLFEGQIVDIFKSSH